MESTLAAAVMGAMIGVPLFVVSVIIALTVRFGVRHLRRLAGGSSS